MRAPLLFILCFLPGITAQSCRNNGKYCTEVLSASVLRYSSLEYKCQFPIFIAKSDILSLDPTVHLTMKIGEYCQKSCCTVIQTSTLPATPSTTPTTTPSTTPTTTAVPTTTAYRTPLEKFNDVMNKDGAFKSLMDVINFNSTAAVGLKRFKVYTEVKKEVDEHNIMYTLGLSSYKMATNQFSVALEGEIAPLTLSLEGLTPTATVSSSTSISERKKRDSTDIVDWRPYMKPILNQLNCGGCWAFSMIAMIESFFEIQGYNTSSLSVQQLLTCDTVKDPKLGLANVGCKGGYFQIAGKYLIKTAPRNADDIPFDMEDSSCDSSFFPPVAPTILLFDDGYISGNLTSAQLITMEKNIEDKVRKSPIAVGMAAGPDIYKYAEGVYDGDCGTTINHAVVIVGFTEDYWIIRNSWGASWGEEGYFRVKRTPGKDPCRFYSYWSQATSIGSAEMYVPPRANGGEFVVPTTTSASVVESTQNSVEECEECEEDCGCDYDDDEDEDDYEEDENEEETSSTTSSTTSPTTTSTTSSSSTSSTTTSTTSPSTTTSTATSRSSTASTTPSRAARTSTTTSTKKKTTTTTPRRTTTPQRSIFEKWSDDWNNFWG